jgi:hypothetical protein
LFLECLRIDHYYNYCDQRLDEALDELDKALLRTNANIDSGANKHIKIINNEDSIKSWDLIYEPKEPISDGFFANLPKIEIADLLKFIGDKMNLWDGFNVSVWGSRSINYHKAIVAYLHNKKEVTIW